ncbi:MAG: N-acetyl-alpha-D-glucosaminyl L-malate synthase BshA [Candidatus Omnitrophota bacterium]
MNIAILCYHRIGGSGIVAYEIGRAMAEDKGYNVHFMGLEPPFRLRENTSNKMQFHKVHLKEYPVFDYQPYELALASQLSVLIKHYAIDVIHSHYALPHAISALLAREISGKPVKLVATLHGTDITVVGAHPGMMDITCYAIEKSDVVTAVSNSLKEETERKLCVTPGRIQVAYNFVNPAFFNAGLRNAALRGEAQHDNKFIITHISNLRPVKRPVEVIKIFHEIYREMGDKVELRIVGEGPLQFDMMRLVEELGIENQVTFLGIRSDIGPIIASSDLFLLPSEQESFGLAALEAMACGVPVVASRVGGLPEVIDDGKSGFLFPLGHIEEAAAKAVSVLKDADLYQAIRFEGINVAFDKFNMNKIVDQYEALYKQ